VLSDRARLTLHSSAGATKLNGGITEHVHNSSPAQLNNALMGTYWG